VPLRYDLPQTCNLRQGEILGDFWEHVVDSPPVRSEEGETFPIKSVHHEYLVVMSPDCDLDWDFKARFIDPESQERLVPTTNTPDEGKVVTHVLLAKLYTRDRIRPRITTRTFWERIEENIDPRYHRLPSAPIGDNQINPLPDLYIDFKKALAVPTTSLYDGFRVRGIKRIALIPNVYIHHLMHRYYGFLSRVALPD
jgi:hypothetical protein